MHQQYYTDREYIGLTLVEAAKHGETDKVFSFHVHNFNGMPGKPNPKDYNPFRLHVDLSNWKITKVHGRS